MQITTKSLSDTKRELSLQADEALLTKTKEEVLRELGRSQVKVQGFRAGKAPLSLIEKQLNPSVLQSEFLDRVINKMYAQAIQQETLRPVDRPEVAVKKFVPFTTLEVTITVEAVGEVTLGDYKKLKLAKKAVKVTDKQVDEVLEALRTRGADKHPVERAAKAGDELTIDFSGTDAVNNQPISGADGKDYPLVLGSDSFIPGFEKNLLGCKVGEQKSFTLTFPKDYGVAALQNRKVTFAVTIKHVQELVKPKLDDAFAAKVGEFSSLDALKADIRTQLTSDQQQQIDREYESDLLEKITAQSTVAIPQPLIDEEVERIEAEEKQNVVYRGQTWQEHLKAEGVSEAEHKQQKRPAAEQRVKAGLVLANIAEAEGITLTDEELEMRLQLLKGQYQDKQMQAELDKPENRRDIAARMVTEKTINQLVTYATSK